MKQNDDSVILVEKVATSYLKFIFWIKGYLDQSLKEMEDFDKFNMLSDDNHTFYKCTMPINEIEYSGVFIPIDISHTKSKVCNSGVKFQTQQAEEIIEIKKAKLCPKSSDSSYYRSENTIIVDDSTKTTSGTSNSIIPAAEPMNTNVTITKIPKVSIGHKKNCISNIGCAARKKLNRYGWMSKTSKNSKVEDANHEGKKSIIVEKPETRKSQIPISISLKKIRKQ